MASYRMRVSFKLPAEAAWAVYRCMGLLVLYTKHIAALTDHIGQLRKETSGYCFQSTPSNPHKDFSSRFASTQVCISLPSR